MFDLLNVHTFSFAGDHNVLVVNMARIEEPFNLCACVYIFADEIDVVFPNSSQALLHH